MYVRRWHHVSAICRLSVEEEQKLALSLKNHTRELVVALFLKPHLDANIVV
jgi:hypothetical protein